MSKINLKVVILAAVALGFAFLAPSFAHADELYTLSVDFSSVPGELPNSTVQWQFEVPSLLTAPATITSFLSTSIGSGLSGCSITDVQIPLASQFNPPYINAVITDFASPCGPLNLPGAGNQFTQSITTEGVFEAFAHSTGTVIGSLTISPVPEPSGLSLFAIGALLLAFGRRRFGL